MDDCLLCRATNNFTAPHHVSETGEWEVIHDHVASRNEERISYAAKYSKTEPIRNYCEYPAGGYGCYMELTADAINELADRGGYDFFLASKLDSYRLGFFNE